VHGEGDSPVDADCRVEYSIEIPESHRSLGHLVDQEAQRVPLQIEEYSNRTSGGDSTLNPPLVD